MIFRRISGPLAGALLLLALPAAAVEFKVTAVTANIPEDFPFPARFCVSREWGGEELSAVSGDCRFADANKVWLDDRNHCWAAAAANLAQWGGWRRYLYDHGHPDIGLDEDSLMAYFRTCWRDVAYLPAPGFGWLIGHNEERGKTLPAGGGLLKDRLIDGCYCFMMLPEQNGGGANFFRIIKASFLSGFGLGIAVKNIGADTSHAFTAWGYEEADGRFWLLCSNSDDFNRPYAGLTRSEVPKTLYRLPVSVDPATGRLITCCRGHYITSLHAIRQFDRAMAGERETEADARPVAAGQDRWGRIDADGDNDFYVFDLPAGASVLEVVMPFRSGDDQMLRLRLCDAAGKTLFDQRVPGYRFELKADRPGRLWLEVSGELSPRSRRDPVFCFDNLYRLRLEPAKP